MHDLPHTVGRYRIIAQLGQGGMARALLALSEGPGGFRKLSVVKELRVDLCDDPAFITMFHEEARLSALLHHPNVVQTHEVGEASGTPFIAMEYLQGQTLAKTMGRVKGQMPLPLYLRVLSEMLTGLHYIHELRDLAGHPLSVVHRDVSPGNLFLTYDGEVKLLDFGIAKSRGGASLTQTGTFKGKLTYVAPEQARTQEVDRRADLFAVGVMLWEGLARTPISPNDEPDVLRLQKRITGDELSIDVAAPSAPVALREVCKKAMAMAPGDRYASALAFREALQIAAGSAGVGSREELADFMARLFASDRQELERRIAQTVSQPLRLPRQSDENSSDERSTDSDSIVELDSAAIEQLHTGSSQRVSETNFHLGGVPVGNETKSHRVATVSALGLVAALAFGGYALLHRAQKGDAAIAEHEHNAAALGPRTPADRADSAAESEEASVPAQIAFTLSVKPASAVVLLDGEELSRPFAASLPGDRELHRLVVSAPGFETATRTLRFDEDRELEIVLEARNATERDESSKEREERSESRRRRRSRAVESDTSSESTSESQGPDDNEEAGIKPGDALPSRNKLRKQRKIDTENPYD